MLQLLTTCINMTCSFIYSLNPLHTLSPIVIKVVGFFLFFFWSGFFFWHDTDQVVIFVQVNFTELGPFFSIWANHYGVGCTCISQFFYLLHSVIISEQCGRNGPWLTVAPKPYPRPVWKSAYWCGPKLCWGQLGCTPWNAMVGNTP